MIVVVLLSILAVIVTPKLFDLRKDAEIAMLQGLKGALSDSSRLVHAKAVIDNLDIGNNTIALNGGNISLRAGYPRVANSCVNFTGQLQYWLSLDIDSAICGASGVNNADWYGVVDLNKFHFMPSNYTDDDENCYVTYTTASERNPAGPGWIDTDSAEVVIETSGCGA